MALESKSVAQFFGPFLMLFFLALRPVKRNISTFSDIPTRRCSYLVPGEKLRKYRNKWGFHGIEPPKII